MTATPDRPTATPPSDRTRVRRKPDRGRYDRATIDAILDTAVVGHVGHVIDGQPFVTPTAVWRQGDRLYWHGSSASRGVRAVQDGAPVCLTVTHLDGLIMARSGFDHSLDYRSVMVVGKAVAVTDPAEKLAALEAFTEHLSPGRWAQLRPATDQELKATAVLWVDLAEASAKVRHHGYVDEPEDAGWPVWAGVIPVRTVLGPAEQLTGQPTDLPAPTLPTDLLAGPETLPERLAEG
jgi:nitroimidazol reductase NimA-like FMN-containing flavoprotein (pyridoxamine 5'-phosphate oxidase superfamily)